MGAQKPWLFRYRSSEWFVILTVAVAAFTVRDSYSARKYRDSLLTKIGDE